MAKHVFRPKEVISLQKKIIIEPPPVKEEEVHDDEALFEESRESFEDFKRSVDEFKANWANEKANLIEKANTEASKIIKEAEEVAFNKVKEQTNEAQKIKQEANTDSNKIIEEAQKKAKELEKEANDKVQEIEKEAYERGYKEGHEIGYKAGREEVDRLIERLHLIIAKTIEKRNEIIEESETQLINLVLLIAKKVIKVISENQKNVVINNVIQALRKLKGRGDVVIRVNLSDLRLSTEHIRDFQKMVENVKNITILEDSSVDKGGCIIETDFGQIDARISSQLNEIEDKILQMMPIIAKGERK